MVVLWNPPGMRQVSGELTTTNSLSLLLKRDGDDQDSSAFDEIVLPERTHHCLLQSIAGTYYRACLQLFY